MYVQIGLLLYELQQVRDMSHESCWKIFEQIGIAMAHPHVFSITMHEIDTTKEVYLEPFQTYML